MAQRALFRCLLAVSRMLWISSTSYGSVSISSTFGAREFSGVVRGDFALLRFLQRSANGPVHLVHAAGAGALAHHFPVELLQVLRL